MNGKKSGYALIVAIIAINLMAVFSLMAASMWEREMNRDLEKELFFRANRYVMAIERFRKKNQNRYPESLEILYEKKFIRKLYKDPLSNTGEWNLVFRSKNPREKALLIIPSGFISKYVRSANLIGVSSTSIDDGYRVYRGKNRYDEWAFYTGQKPDKDMPELKFITD